MKSNPLHVYGQKIYKVKNNYHDDRHFFFHLLIFSLVKEHLRVFQLWPVSTSYTNFILDTLYNIFFVGKKFREEKKICRMWPTRFSRFEFSMQVIQILWKIYVLSWIIDCPNDALRSWQPEMRSCLWNISQVELRFSDTEHIWIIQAFHIVWWGRFDVRQRNMCVVREAADFHCMRGHPGMLAYTLENI